MAIHPDDPPYSIFGLPRVVKNRDDLDWICRAVDSPANGITLCTGSIAEDPDNDVYAILAEFTRRKRIHFAHVRNIKLMQDKDFYECAHPSEYGSPGYVQGDASVARQRLRRLYTSGSWPLYLGRDRTSGLWFIRSRTRGDLPQRSLGGAKQALTPS